MAYKPRDPSRHNPGANPALAEPGWSPPSRRPKPHWSNNPQLPDVEELAQEVERARRLGADNPHIPRLAERAQELERELRALLSARAEAEGVSVGRRGPRGPAAPGDLIGTTSAEASDRILARQHFENASKILGEEGFVGNVGPGPGAAADAAIYAPRRVAAKTALKGVGGIGAGLGLDWLSAYSEGARDIDDWMAQEEEFITGLPGLVSPSELPPPAVLASDRTKAVEATQGMTGVAPDPESDNVTAQEVRAYIKNRVAKGKKLPQWAQSITSMEGGKLSIKPVNPRKKARQEAAKPHNPRMGGPKRKHGVPTRADTINRENRRKAKAGY